MISRALISYHENINSEDNDVSIGITWHGVNPGDDVETRIRNYLLEIDITIEISHFMTCEGNLIYLNWLPVEKIGTTAVFTITKDDILDVSHICLKYAQVVLKHYNIKPKTWDQLTEVYSDDELPKVIPDLYKQLDPLWLKYSLEGGTINLQYKTETEFMIRFSQFLETFPWSIYFIEFGDINESEISLNFVDSQLGNAIPQDELYMKIVTGDKEEFWYLLLKALIILKYKPIEERSISFAFTLLVIYGVTSEFFEPFDKIDFAQKYVGELLNLDVDYTINFINTILSTLETYNPSKMICLTLIDLAQELIHNNFADLARLVEGTAMDMVFKLNDHEDQSEILFRIIDLSTKWGTQFLIDFINGISTILLKDQPGKNLFSEILNKVNDLLINSWDGLLCLVNSHLYAGNTKKAMNLRFSASSKIFDKTTKAEEIFMGMNWGLEQDNIMENDYLEVCIPYFEIAINNMENQELFLEYIPNLLQIAMKKRKLVIIEEIGYWILNNPHKFIWEIRDKLLDSILLIKELNNHIITPYKLAKIDFLLEESSTKLIDNSDQVTKLMRSLYNTINPSTMNSTNVLISITEYIVISAAKYDSWDIIDEAVERFTLLMNESKETVYLELTRIFLRGMRIRSKLHNQQLKYRDIGILLFTESLRYQDELNKKIISTDDYNQAKWLSMKTKSYEDLVNFSIAVAIKLRVEGESWIESLVPVCKDLLSKDNIDMARLLFDRAKELDLSETEKIEIIKIELEIVDIEPDLLTADEIFQRRSILIGSSPQHSAGLPVSDIIQQYRFGIAELITKGDTANLDEFLLQAIEFTMLHQLDEFSEFSSLFLDNFKLKIDTYIDSHNNQIYYYLNNQMRKLTLNINKEVSIFVLQLLNLMVESNLLIYNQENKYEYIKRILVILNEFLSILHLSNENDNLRNKEIMMAHLKTVDSIISIRNQNFGTVESLIELSRFYIWFGEIEYLFHKIDLTLLDIKNSVKKDQGGISGLLVGLYLIVELYQKFNDPSLNSKLRERAIWITNLIHNESTNNEIVKAMSKLKHGFNTDLAETMRLLPSTVKIYLKWIDSYQFLVKEQ
ncbi:MAG: hypothetical protein OEY49_02040 [Candidatus Heimdallarchaeota archaeon]|nr:hypothetical protein [Candidatus Heimdallarchaeota archaeon]